MGEFQWPWQYNFPPFFTIQPNLDTRQKQIDGWCALVLAFHRHNRIYTLDVVESQSTPLFYNKKIDRKLPVDGINIILEELRKRGHIEWTDKSRKQCFVTWRTPEEWGKLIYQWASSNGMSNSVCTAYELISGDDTASEEFHGLDMAVLTKALKTLELQGKAEIMGGGGTIEGVKFF